jgi:phosphomannomutase
MNKTEPVKFGTDGWRAVIGDDYTFVNVRRVSQATASNFKNHPKINNGIAIGYDTRFLSKEFAIASAVVFANNGIKVYLTDSFVTTPTVSLLVKYEKLAFGVVITASHNPFKYNGFKLKDEYGGSMYPDEILKIEDNLKYIQEVHEDFQFDELIKNGKIELIDGKKYYLDNLKHKIDIDKINSCNLKIIYDAMYGAGQGSLKALVNADELHSELNPYFGGGAPEPVPKNLTEICNKIKTEKYNIGIVTDGDADRIAIIDENGDFVDAQKTFALLLHYLFKYKKMSGKVVRGYSTSDLISKYCTKYGIPLETVPIGFKHISKIMINEDVLIGAEESGGIGIKGHLPERDGVFNGLLYLEMLASTGKSISELKEELENEFGVYFYQRIDVHTTHELKQQALKTCAEFKVGGKIGGHKILEIGNLDGYKFTFSNGWIIVRASGTEPLLRFYCETENTNDTSVILNNTINQFNLNK